MRDKRTSSLREEGRPDVVGRTSQTETKSGYRDLLAWQLGMELVRSVCFLTNSFPNHELFGLISQLRRAAVSVPSNIAEGYRRKSHRDFSVFIGHSRGPLAEIKTQLEIAHDLDYITEGQWGQARHKTDRLAQVLAGLNDWAEKN